MREIPLSKGMVALVSDEDYDRVSQFKWYASLESRGTKWYAVRKVTINGKRVKIRMHRFVAGLPPGEEDKRVVDHKDHNSLNNQRENLEVIDQTENMHRSKGWKGSRTWKEARGGEDVSQSSIGNDYRISDNNSVSGHGTDILHSRDSEPSDDAA